VLLSSGAASDGQLGDAIRGAAAAREGVRTYVEVHIEQGPVLEDLGVPLGVVTAIAGQTFLHVSMRGSQGHAGAVPMETRRDTLAAAADAVLAVERGCQGAAEPAAPSQPCLSTRRAADGVRFTSEEGLVCTVGQLSVWPGASNVIAGLVNFTVDLRSRQNAIRSGACAAQWTLGLRALSPPPPPQSSWRRRGRRFRRCVPGEISPAPSNRRCV